MTVTAGAPLPPILGDLGNSEAVTENLSVYPDSTHLFVGLLSLVLIAAGLIGILTSNTDLETVGLMLFAVLGLGTSVFQLSQTICGLRFLTYGLSLSAALIALTGTVLVELHLWAAGIGIFVVYAAIGSVLHVVGVDRHRPALKGLLRRFSQFKVASKESLLVTGALVGTLVCLLAAIADQNPSLGLSGLLGSISPIWYLGLVCIVAAFVLGARARNSIQGLPVVLLILVLTLTPAIVFHEPLYPWVAKHVGVTNFFIAHGQISKHVDATVAIYQAWPGLFSGIAWLCHVCGFADPWQVARWWPPIIDLAGVIAIRLLGQRIGLTTRQAWIAVALWFLANTFGQDYYSPQSLAYFLGLVVFCVVVKQHESDRAVSSIDWLVLILASCGMAVTHQLTPFMVSAAVLVVTLFGFARSRWMVVVSVVPASLWTAAHYSYVRAYLRIDQIGNVTANISTPGSRDTSFSNDLYVHLSVAGQVVAALLLGVIALIVLIQWRTRLHLMLACSALSGGALLFFSSYGNEGLFRVTLFSIPWLALLAAHGEWRQSSAGYVVTLAVIPVMLTAYLLGAWAIDYGYEIRPGDIAAISAFERIAPRNAVLISVGTGALPQLSTGIYKNVFYYNYEDIRTGAIENGHFNATRSVALLTKFFSYSKTGAAASARAHNANYFLVTASESQAQSALRGVATLREYSAFQKALQSSPDWVVVAKSKTAMVFRLNVH